MVLKNQRITNMEVLVLTGTNKLEVKSTEKPEVKPNEVIID